MEALIKMGVDKEEFQKILDKIISIQNSDGSWGITENGGCVEETALAINALILGGISSTTAPIEKGISYILNNQNDSGSWDPTPLGLFPPITYSNKYWTINLIIRALTLVNQLKND